MFSNVIQFSSSTEKFTAKFTIILISGNLVAENDNFILLVKDYEYIAIKGSQH